MFTFREDRVRVDQKVPEPLQEQTFSPQLLRQIQYRHADQRLEVLSRLPEVIRGAIGDDELFVRLVNMLLAGIPRAGVAAVTAVATIPEVRNSARCCTGIGDSIRRRFSSRVVS